MLSLVTIIAIYREGGILKRLRATPLRPHTILTAHVLVKLLFTAVTLAVDGRWPAAATIRWAPTSRSCRSRWRCCSAPSSILSLGFLIASIVPTARFAQPIGTLILYPMLGAVRAVRAGRLAAAGAAGGRPRAAAHLRGVAAERHLARRGLVRPRRRRGGPDADVRGVHGAVGQSVSLGVDDGVPGGNRSTRRNGATETNGEERFDGSACAAGRHGAAGSDRKHERVGPGGRSCFRSEQQRASLRDARRTVSVVLRFSVSPCETVPPSSLLDDGPAVAGQQQLAVRPPRRDAVGHHPLVEAAQVERRALRRR